MNTISIGIYVDGQVERLRWTLASLHANTSPDVEILVLLDGVALNETAMRTLPAWNRVRVSATSDARGAAACFNRLASQTVSDVLVLLESGVTVAPGWLDRLPAAPASPPPPGL